MVSPINLYNPSAQEEKTSPLPCSSLEERVQDLGSSMWAVFNGLLPESYPLTRELKNKSQEEKQLGLHLIQLFFKNSVDPSLRMAPTHRLHGICLKDRSKQGYENFSKELQACIQEGADLTDFSFSGETFVYKVVIQKDYELLKRLLEGLKENFFIIASTVRDPFITVIKYEPLLVYSFKDEEGMVQTRHYPLQINQGPLAILARSFCPNHLLLVIQYALFLEAKKDFLGDAYTAPVFYFFEKVIQEVQVRTAPYSEEREQNTEKWIQFFWDQGWGTITLAPSPLFSVLQLDCSLNTIKLLIEKGVSLQDSDQECFLCPLLSLTVQGRKGQLKKFQLLVEKGYSLNRRFYEKNIVQYLLTYFVREDFEWKRDAWISYVKQLIRENIIDLKAEDSKGNPLYNEQDIKHLSSF